MCPLINLVSYFCILLLGILECSTQIMKTMKPDPKQINAMHTEWCGRYTPEELAASGVCKMWETRKSEF